MRKNAAFIAYAAITSLILLYAAARFVMGGAPVEKIRLHSDEKIGDDVRAFITANANDPAKIAAETPALFPNIGNITVRNNRNGTADVMIEYKKIAGVWESGGAFYPLLEDGSHINAPYAARPKGALAFRGALPEIAGIAMAVKGCPDLAARADYLEYVEGRRWNVILRGGGTVWLPEENVRGALGRLKSSGILSKSFEVLDLRNPERMLVKR